MNTRFRSARIDAALVFLSVSLGACAAGGGVPDSGDGMDAGPTRDAGERDAGGGGTDAGGTDAGGTDGGAALDGSSSDAGVGTDGGGAMDSGPPSSDAGAPDAGCSSAADCDDGTACNGAEVCSVGFCLPGTAPVCDDGIACTIDTCVEPSGACTATPTDSLCPGGMMCTSTGCMGACLESPCRLVSPQCGCAATQGCYLSGTTRLCAAAGSIARGGACTSVNDCAPGNMCINVSRTTGVTINRCTHFCNNNLDCGGNSVCFYTLGDGAGGTIPGVTLCTVDCDPALQTGCSAGTMCTILQETAGAMRIFTDCVGPVGAGGQGAACTALSDCQAGYACIGTPGQCLRWCDRPGMIAAGGCMAGEACYGFMTPLTVGSRTYGVCDVYP
ncbi:MAG: hypothetical protein AB7S26_23865 [Sandaracinaceae bacterium]